MRIMRTNGNAKRKNIIFNVKQNRIVCRHEDFYFYSFRSSASNKLIAISIMSCKHLLEFIRQISMMEYANIQIHCQPQLDDMEIKEDHKYARHTNYYRYINWPLIKNHTHSLLQISLSLINGRKRMELDHETYSHNPISHGLRNPHFRETFASVLIWKMLTTSES